MTVRAELISTRLSSRWKASFASSGRRHGGLRLSLSHPGSVGRPLGLLVELPGITDRRELLLDVQVLRRKVGISFLTALL